jgi:hypothetical protein
MNAPDYNEVKNLCSSPNVLREIGLRQPKRGRVKIQPLDSLAP